MKLWVSLCKCAAFCCGWLMWLPNLTVELFSAGGDSNILEVMFISLGLVLPVSLLFLSNVYGWSINPWGSFVIGGFWLGSLIALGIYLIIGLVAHFTAKQEWGGGIIYY